MRMEAIQKYVISMTREEADALRIQIGRLPSVNTDGVLMNLYEILSDFLYPPLKDD